MVVIGKKLQNEVIYDLLPCSVLVSLNLPAAIEDLSGDKVPKSVLEKAEKVQERGGVATIDTLMQDLPEMLQRNREVLDEVNLDFL